MIRRIFLTALCLLPVGVFAAPDAKGPGKPAMPPVTVEVVTVAKETLAQNISAVGTVMSNEAVEIRSEVTGRVEQIHFKDGATIKTGQPIITLEDSVQQAELNRAQADVELKRNNVKRAKELTTKGFASEVRLEEAQAEYKLAQATVELAKANLAKTRIVAPFSGKLGIRRVSPGDYVSPGEVLVNLDQMEKVKIEFTVPERYLPQVKVGSEVALTSDARPGQPLKAKINAIESRIAEQNRSIQIQALADNKDAALYSGQFVQVSLPLAQQQAGLVVPDQSLVPIGNQVFVFRVKDDAVEKVVVKTGARTQSKAQIIEGLQEGDVIVSAGQQRLQDGAKVAPRAPTAVEPSTMPEEKVQQKNE